LELGFDNIWNDKILSDEEWPATDLDQLYNEVVNNHNTEPEAPVPVDIFQNDTVKDCRVESNEIDSSVDCQSSVRACSSTGSSGSEYDSDCVEVLSPQPVPSTPNPGIHSH
jgi:hypothetical protein